MRPVLSLIFLLFFSAVDSDTATNSSAHTDREWKSQKPLIRKSPSRVNNGSEHRNRSAIGGYSFQPPSGSTRKPILITPSSAAGDVSTRRRKNTSVNSHSPRSTGHTLEVLPTSTSGTPLRSRLKSGSHLRLHKTNDDRIIILENDKERTRTTRKVGDPLGEMEGVVHGNEERKRHRTQRFLYDSNLRNTKMFTVGDRDSQAFKYNPEVSGDTGDRYYYNDFGSDENHQQLDRPFPYAIRGEHQIVPRRFQADSCRKYLEFLRYAFQQLDNPARRLYLDDQDEYIYYDEDFNKAEPKMLVKSYVTMPPPIIKPDMTVLHRMAVTEYEIPPKEAEAASVSGSYDQEKEKKSSKSPGTNKSSTVVSSKSSSPLTLEVFTQAEETTVTAASLPASEEQYVTEPYKHPESTSSTSARSVTSKAVTRNSQMSENCHDKLFPCPDNINVTYPVNGFCNRFVACEAGKPHPEFCQDGLHFNLVERQCDLPHNSFCTYSCPTADGYYAVPGDCEGFFRCSNWYPEYRMCPPRMHWDNKAKICTFEELSSCPLKCDSTFQVKPYRGVCNSYVICTRGVPRYHQCPDGNHFDGKQLRCTPKMLSNCTDDVDYIVRNRGIENGKKTLCADIELKNGGKARWCQETSKLSEHKRSINVNDT